MKHMKRHKNTDRKVPTKPVNGNGVYYCPHCRESLEYGEMYEIHDIKPEQCCWCGQLIDWEYKGDNENEKD